MLNKDNKMLWDEDEVFDYVGYDNTPLVVAWNLDNDEVEISFELEISPSAIQPNV